MKTKILAVLAVLAVLAWLLLRVPHFESRPHPARDYAEAMRLFGDIEKREASLALSPEGKSRIFTHGKKTERAFVLLHGLTNCPEQFVPLARILHSAGYNVVLPRARYAGFADLMNDFQGLQSGQDLLDQAASGLDIAAGLGERVTVVGLSGSAVAAAWMAQNREGIEQVLILSPFFSLYGYPVWVVDLLAAVLSRAPNFYKWWDDERQENRLGPPYAYPRYGSRSMADTVQLSRAVRAEIPSTPLKAGRLDILTTATDIGANNALTDTMAATWKSVNPGKVTSFEFPKSAGVPHDMIDIHQPDEQTAITYPKILSVLGVPVAPLR